MARNKLFMVVMGIAVASATTVNGQSKKEVIAMLSKKTDSLERVIVSKNEGIQKLEVKLARLEGAAEAHNEVIRRIESRSDSLRDALTTKNADVESLTAKVTALSSELEGLKTERQEWASRNDTLQAQLEAFTEKAPDPAPKAAVRVVSSKTASVPMVSGAVVVRSGTRPASAASSPVSTPKATFNKPTISEESDIKPSEAAGSDSGKAATEPVKGSGSGEAAQVKTRPAEVVAKE